MTSLPVKDGLNGLPDLANLRVERDRALALAYVAKGKSKSAVKEICESTGINCRAVYRALERELNWALSQQQETPPGDTSEA